AIAMQLANSDVQNAIAWAQKLPDGSGKQNALISIVSQWTDSDPQAAANFALRLSDVPGSKNLLENISRQWARVDVQAAIAWVSSLPSASRDSVLPGII